MFDYTLETMVPREGASANSWGTPFKSPSLWEEAKLSVFSISLSASCNSLTFFIYCILIASIWLWPDVGVYQSSNIIVEQSLLTAIFTWCVHSCELKLKNKLSKIRSNDLRNFQKTKQKVSD